MPFQPIGADPVTGKLPDVVEGRLKILTATWQPNFAYTTGMIVRSPDGNLVKVITNHTSGAFFDPSKFSTSDGLTAAINALISAGVPPLVAVPVAALVPPAVAQAIATDATVATAAANAVSGALANSSVVTGGTSLNDAAVAFSITDQKGYRSWLEMDYSGKPTTESAKTIAKAIQTLIDYNTALTAAGALLSTSIGDNTVGFSITDQSGKRSWLEMGLDGKPTPNSAAIIAAAVQSLISVPNSFVPLSPESGYSFAITDLSGRIGFGVNEKGEVVVGGSSGGSTASVPRENTSYTVDTFLDTASKRQVRSHDRVTGVSRALTSGGSSKFDPYLTSDNMVVYLDSSSSRGRYVPAQGGTSWPFLADDAWAAFGDSLTAGGWPQILAGLIGKTVENWGIGGQTSIQIAARQNGAPQGLTLSGNQIPADTTPVTVTNGGQFYVRPTDPSIFVPGGEAHNSFTIYLAGVEGVLAVSDTSVYTFTRKVAGSVVAVPANTTPLTKMGLEAQGKSLILWAGRNNITQPSQIVTDTQAMIAYNKPRQKRVQMMSILPSVDDGPTGSSAYNNVLASTAALNAAFPGQVLDIATYLRSDQAFVDAGITKTTQDASDVSNGWTPLSFRGDTLHLNTLGYTLVAKRLRQELITKGWV